MSEDSFQRSQQLPAYTYVPGRTPHPVSDPAGHLHGCENRIELLPQGTKLSWGRTLLNCGFYCESHEVWEHLWMDLGRTSADAMTVKGLIKLAACGVKCLEANHNGAQRHAQRAFELIDPGNRSPLFQTLDLVRACEVADVARVRPPVFSTASDGEPTALSGFVLHATNG